MAESRAVRILIVTNHSAESASPQKDGSVRHVSQWQPPTSLLSPFASRRALVGALALGWVLSYALDTVWAQHGGAPGTKPAAKKPQTKTAPAVRPAPPAPPEPVDPKTGLPVGFQPKKDPTDLMTLDQPLAADDTIAKWKKDVNEYQKRLRQGDMTPAGKAVISNGIKYRIALMTLKDNQQNLHKFREDLTVRDMNLAGLLLNKPQQVKDFRRFVMEEVAKEAAPLLENNFYVRVHGATLYGELNLTVENSDKTLKLETYTPAVEPLRKVLRDPNQPEAVKIAAARGIVRLVRFGELPANKRFETAKDVLAALAVPDIHYWYQMRLIDALSTLDVPKDLETQKPTIVPALTAIVLDPKRNWHVRAEAARALGRVPLDPQVNISNLVQALAQLGLDMTKAAQQQPKQPQWKMTFYKLYLAFQPHNAEDRDAAKKGKAGLLNNASAAALAKQPYDLVVPVLNNVLNDKPITAEQVKGFEDWVSKNSPRSAVQANQPANLAPNTSGPVSNGGTAK
jgi:hypothetical protein